jgi:hypothetical protein
VAWTDRRTPTAFAQRIYWRAGSAQMSIAFGDRMKRPANAGLLVISSTERMESTQTMAIIGRYIRPANGARLG